MKKILVLYGDSHVARLDKALMEPLYSLGYEVLNCACPGWDSRDAAGALQHMRIPIIDTLVLSLGTNDSAPWKKVALESTRDNIQYITTKLKSLHIIFVLPPPMDESRLQGMNDRTNRLLEEHCNMIREICSKEGWEVIDLWGWDHDQIQRNHIEDGVHITREAAGEWLVEGLVNILGKTS